MRILMITPYVPYPPFSGNPLRNFNLLTRLAQDHDIWLATFATSNDEQDGVEYLLRYCRGVVTAKIEDVGALGRPLDAIRYFLLGRPPDLRYYDSYEFAEKIRELVSTIDFDIIQIEDSYMGLYLNALPKKIWSKTILVFHDIIFSKYERLARIEPKGTRKIRKWLNGKMMRLWEPSYARHFGRCVVMSESDRKLLGLVNSELKIEIIPNGVDTKLYQPLPTPANPRNLLFVGNMSYRPNIDAMIFFCKEILPIICKELSVELWIVGVNPSPELAQLAGDDIHITGRVEDLRPYYEKSAVCVVPLRAGGGTRLKILEAMALGRPVVSTTIGCEGIDAIDGRHLFIADTPEQFAEKTLALLTDLPLRQRIVDQARDFVVVHHDWDAIVEKLVSVYRDIMTNA